MIISVVYNLLYSFFSLKKLQPLKEKKKDFSTLMGKAIHLAVKCVFGAKYNSKSTLCTLDNSYAKWTCSLPMWEQWIL